jgi:hypothetical protein
MGAQYQNKPVANAGQVQGQWAPEAVKPFQSVANQLKQ